MRLRRETGDFSIKFDTDATEVTIRKNLNSEDLVGCVVQQETAEGTGMTVIVSVVQNKTTGVVVLAPATGDSYNYDPNTGKVTKA